MTYDPADNSAKCYAEAIKAIRLQGIREGKFKPRKDNREEMSAHRQYQISKGMLAWWKRRKGLANA